MAYSVFSGYYDALTENVGYQVRAEYFDALIQKYMSNAHLLVDLACGTGSLSLCLAGKGYEVIGVDRSPEMLAQAFQKAAAEEKDILFLCQDMRSLDLYGTNDVTICALDSLNHILSLEELETIFQRVNLFTNKDGLFIFDVNTIYKHREILANNTFVYDYDDLYCVWQNSYEEKKHQVEISLDFFERDKDVYYRTSETFSERAYEVEELKSLAERTGFEVLAIYGEDTFLPPKEDTQRIVFVLHNLNTPHA